MIGHCGIREHAQRNLACRRALGAMVALVALFALMIFTASAVAASAADRAQRDGVRLIRANTGVASTASNPVLNELREAVASASVPKKCRKMKGSRRKRCIAAEKKKAKARKKKKVTTCQVLIRKDGKWIGVTVNRLAYKKVRRKGKIRRIIITKKVKVTAKCPPQPCQKLDVNDKGVFETKKAVILVKSRGRLVKRKRNVKMPVITYEACKDYEGGLVVAVEILEGSEVELDWDSVIRHTAIRGWIKGYMTADKYVVDEPNTIIFSGASLTVDPVGVFLDDKCKGRVTTALGTHYTSVALDASKDQTMETDPSQRITGSLTFIVRIALSMRPGSDGCDDPYLVTGYTDTNLRLRFNGTFNATKTQVKTVETYLDLWACITPGDPDKPCSSYRVPFPTLVRTKVLGKVYLGTNAKRFLENQGQ